MRILIATQGHYGERIADNIRKSGPAGWKVYTFTFPRNLPAVIDDAAEFLPKELPAADLLISLGEHPGVAQMIPDMVKMSGAKAVVAPADDRTWLPPGLAKQIKRKLESMGVDMVYPVPFCTLSEKDSKNQYILEFAKYFGRPEFNIDIEDEKIKRVAVVRGSPCGCSRFVAEALVGVRERESVDKAGLMHHQYPCLATMVIDQEFEDPLMHRAGLMTKLATEKAVKAAKSGGKV